MRNLYEYYAGMIEKRIEEPCSVDERLPQKRLLEAMRYSLTAGGKRIRPVIVLAFCAASGGDPRGAMDFAVAVEMLHTYSLIHDDLPCMDNDDLRRGKPTNHIVFGEAAAVLAGDALQASAFNMVLNAELPERAVVEAGRVLAHAAGEMGICGGQMLDIDGENHELSLEQIRRIHELKTVSMIAAAAKIGCIAAGGGKQQLNAAEKYARCLGLAFQVRDDILDYYGDPDKLGKPVGSDSKNKKNTFVTQIGLEACEEFVMKETERAKAALMEGGFSDITFLRWLAESLGKREK